MRRILLCVQSLSADDAVSNDVIGMYRVLEHRGVDVRMLPSSLAELNGYKVIDLEAVADFLSDPDDIIIYHFGVHWHQGEVLLQSLKCKKIIKYHNITPHTFFKNVNMEYEESCRQGRLALKKIIGLATEIWSDSSYSSEEIVDLGFPRVRTRVIPPMHQVESLLSVEPDASWMHRLSDGRPTILTVGRLAPNKGHLRLLNALKLVQKQIPEVRLIMAGSHDKRLKLYLDKVAEGVGCFSPETVLVPGKVTQEELAALYRASSLFVMPSLHEGFCVPLIESMAFGLGVVGQNAAAIPETLGNVGILVEDETCERLAETITSQLKKATEHETKAQLESRFHDIYSQKIIEDKFLTAIVPFLRPHNVTPVAIHQFHSGSAAGDGVTNGMFFVRKLLRELGYQSEIFVEHVADQLKGELKKHTELVCSKDEVLLVHHSMGHDLDAWLENLPGKKFLVYHNITPSRFFPPSSAAYKYITKGYSQLKSFKELFDAAIADSEINSSALREEGYADIETLPLLFDSAEIQRRQYDKDLVLCEASKLTILFVGRIMPHKCIHDFLGVAVYLKALFKRQFQFVLVGGYELEDPYYVSLLKEITKLGLAGTVRFVGKVSDKELSSWYRIADVFLCLSEHEGFCIPVVEAMIYDVPVIAWDSSNLRWTLGGAGLLIKDKNHAAIAALIKLLLEDKPLKRRIIQRQRIRLKEVERDKLKARLATWLRRQGIGRVSVNKIYQSEASHLRYQIEGPIETSYSLALTNRETAFALDRLYPGEVGVYPTEGPGDYPVDVQALQAIPGLSSLNKTGNKGARADVVVRHLYPPRVADMNGLINILNFAWEESEIPPEWVGNFNLYLDGVAAVSTFVKKTLIDNGVFIPIAVVGNAADHILRAPAESYQYLGKGFKFLHVSSCFPRKAVDVILLAFAKAFSSKEDVTLVIKSFPNPHNTLMSQVAAIRRAHPDCGEIIVINEDLSVGQLADLYRQCQAFVCPSRGEGFGMPIAEAMLVGLPVIATNYGGQLDFCNDNTAWLVDYKFEHSASHLGLHNSVWAEPELSSLIQQMRAIYGATDQDVKRRVINARRMIERRFSWDASTGRLHSFQQSLRQKLPFLSNKIKLGWISSWNTKCGIASYSRCLLNELNHSEFKVQILASKTDILAPDEENVRRLWLNRWSDLLELEEALNRSDFDVLVIQFNFGFFTPAQLASLIRKASNRKMRVIVFLHSTADVSVPGQEATLSDVVEDLKLCARVLVHGVDDLNRLKKWGLVEQAALFPHGISEPNQIFDTEARLKLGLPSAGPIIATFGFLLPHKGLEELIRALPSIHEQYRNAHLLLVTALYPAPESTETLLRCQQTAKELGVEKFVHFRTDYLSESDVLNLLGVADLVVFPYQKTSESSSAAVRFGLASGRPVLCTPLSIFSDVRPLVTFLYGTSSEAISEGVRSFLSAPDKSHSASNERRSWIASRSWTTVGMRLSGLLKAVVTSID